MITLLYNKKDKAGGGKKCRGGFASEKTALASLPHILILVSTILRCLFCKRGGRGEDTRNRVLSIILIKRRKREALPLSQLPASFPNGPALILRRRANRRIGSTLKNKVCFQYLWIFIYKYIINITKTFSKAEPSPELRTRGRALLPNPTEAGASRVPKGPEYRRALVFIYIYVYLYIYIL